ncbi:MAG TPA: hypothetical protein VF200_12375 [Woeseiaceae bacterium]
MPSPLRFGAAPMLAAAALLAAAGGAADQATTSPPAEQVAGSCAGAVHREFDFWVGTWDVRSEDGELLGRNEITRIAHGCGLLENWHGADGGEGMSISTWDRGLGKWTQRWVGAGSVLWLEGGLDEGRMILGGVRQTRVGPVQDRITWTPLAEGRVSQVWEISADGGKSWRLFFAGYYSAAGDAPTPAAAARARSGS